MGSYVVTWSEWCRGKALAFKTIGRGPASVFSISDVGDVFQFQFINQVGVV